MNYHHLKSCPFKGVASIIGFSLGLISTQSLAQPSESTQTLVQCMAIEDSLERVGCYDMALGREARPVVEDNAALTDPESELAPEVVSEVIDTVSSTEEQVKQFGLEEAVVRENDNGESELLDTVVAIKETQPQKWLITLSSGQVWKQSIAKRFRLKEGSEIRIFQTGWGGDYRLGVVGRSGFIQVTRLK